MGAPAERLEMQDQAQQADTSWARDLPRKRCSAGALIRNPEGALLIVKPTYRPDWLLPGGIVESGEAPLMSMIREVREEVGIEVQVHSLLYVDYLQADAELGDALHFLFDCGTVSAAVAESARAIDPELSDIRWASPEEAKTLLAAPIAKRLQQPPGHYLHQGQPQTAFFPCESPATAPAPSRYLAEDADP
jgi:8-oxo-dGTP diphosphatase